MSNPYLLPEGKVQISFSGGRTSAYMLHQILEANNGLPDNAIVSFQNTGREMPQTLDFVQEVSERWNVPIVWLEYDRIDGKPAASVVSHNSASRLGEPFEKLIEAKKVLPNTLMRFCTVELKINTAKRYLKKLGWKEWSNAVGIRADEPDRLARAPKKDCWVPWRPLVTANVDNNQISEFWKAQSFNLMLPVSNGRTMYGNCDGCFLKSESQLVMLAREYPEKYDWWVQQEKNHKHRGDWGVFRRDRPLAELRDFINVQADWIFDEEGYFCQKDDGECTG